VRTQRATTQCQKCKAEIGWVITRNGKNMPVDAESLSEVDIEILGRVGEKVEYRRGEHVCHFETCPNAKEFRR
jgi:hypothetical protein